MHEHETHYKTHRSHPTHFFLLSLALLGAIMGFVFLFQTYRSYASHAYENGTIITIKLQGELPQYGTIKARVTLYKSLGKVKEYENVVFTSTVNKTFEGVIAFDPLFDYNALYALYIKPVNYFGKLFCSTSVNGKNCTAPQVLFSKSGNSLDLTNTVFSGGDIYPVNGQVDAEDMSRIITNLGKNEVSTDINGDGITSTIDYSLAFYSFNNGVRDDAYTLAIPWAPTITITPPIATPTFPFPSSIQPTMPNFRTTAGICQINPAPFSVRLCNTPVDYIASTSGFGNCQDMYARSTKCSAIYTRKQCSCPNEKLCICQLKDQLSQTVSCTQGGSLIIEKCK